MPLPDINRICVVLVSTRNPLNIGAAARAMSNFGIRNLRLVKPFDPGFREARSAVGAAATLQDARIFASVAEAVADCTLVIGTTGGRDRHLDNSLRRLQDAAPLVKKETAHGNVAILFGSEKRGLSNDDLTRCHWLLHIPAQEDHLSMNLGQAAAVCLYEISRHIGVTHSQTSQPDQPTPAITEEIDRLAAVWFETLFASGYVKPGAGAITEEKLRRMVRRMNLSTPDTEVWMGMLRQVLWKLNH